MDENDQKLNYLKASFNNVQELIMFTDQKIGFVLVLCGIEITVFTSTIENLNFSLISLTILNVSIFGFGFLFLALLLIIIYLCVFKVLRPGFAINYSNKDYSCYYFEHIALNEKDLLKKNIKKLNRNTQIKEIGDQLFEVSKILNRKNVNCAKIFNILYINIIILIIYVLLTNLV